MGEKPSDRRSVEKYLRREDTMLAKALHGVCSLRGGEYRNSSFKYGLELAIVLPALTVAIPVSAILGVAAKLEDGGSMFFVQERVGKDGKPLSVAKIRTMKPGSETAVSFLEHHGKFESGEDPRNTRIGRLVRASDLDELPQLLKVVTGEMSLIDVRCVDKVAIDRLRQLRPETFEEWYQAYIAGTPGIVNLYSAASQGIKFSTKKHHYDMLYAKKAKLGMDLFILYKTSQRIYRRIKAKLVASRT